MLSDTEVEKKQKVFCFGLSVTYALGYIYRTTDLTALPAVGCVFFFKFMMKTKLGSCVPISSILKYILVPTLKLVPNFFRFCK